MADQKLPTGRIQRLSKVGAAAASQAVKQSGTRAANLTRSEEKGAKAMERRQIEAARQVVRVLGGMKGAAMKVGQVLSFMDLGLVPEEYREEFQAELAKLRDAAPTVAFDQMKKVIETDLDDKLENLYADFDPEPIAAASIGQVYRAKLDDGQEVAVKVQYPGIADAVEADMKNLGMLLRLAKRITPQMDVKAVGREISERIVEELDYELEAGNQRQLARLYRDHPFIYIPGVVRSHCRRMVITTELVHGDGFEAIQADDQAERNRVAEIIFRFYFGSMYRHLCFSGDPHPGNLIRMTDGRIAFLDFGLFKTIDKTTAEIELGCQRAATEGNAEELHRLFSEAGFLPQPDKLDADALLAYVSDGIGWYTSAEQPVKVDVAMVNHVAIQSSDPRSTHFRAMRHQDVVPEHLFGRRLELLMLAVIGQLEAEADWHAIAREWMYRDEPVTELGKQETAYLEETGLS